MISPVNFVPPDTQTVIHRICLVNPAIAIEIVGSQVGKPVAGARTEQFAAIGDTTVLVTVDGEKSTVRRQKRD